MQIHFRTPVPEQKAPFGIDHHDRLGLTGSCFAEHIGRRLTDRKFQCLINPFGIVYNPVSMAQSLERLLEPEKITREEDLFYHEGLWRSFDHHGRFAHPDKGEAISAIQNAFMDAARAIPSVNRWLLTLGTADVHYLKENGRIVANNHKMPASVFETRRLSIEETVEALKSPLLRLKSLNPDLKVVITVSPLRHLRRGHVANQRSKSVLVLAAAALEEALDFVYYFPAYELLLDDLRDYRFYATDMIHPSDTAVDYIWNFFDRTFFDDQTRLLNAAIEKIRTAAHHRPFHPGSESWKRFAAAQMSEIQKLTLEYPWLDLSEELDGFLSDS